VDEVVSMLVSCPTDRRIYVAVDGGDASGKTTYADRLADALRRAGRSVLVIHVDDFMHPPAVRHRRGRTSAEGYLEDSYDYDALTHRLHEPLDRSTITVVEGLFLLRDELADRWDYSVFLDVPIEVALERKRQRDELALTPGDPLEQRYVEGQRLYRERHRPLDRATWVVEDSSVRQNRF
jgi:uridine kinase